jgi:tRNA(Ile)-lysidine synthase
MRCPIQHEQSSRSHRQVSVAGDPANVSLRRQHPGNPGIETAAHRIKNRIRRFVNIGKHRLAMARNQAGVGNCRFARLQHSQSIRDSRMGALELCRFPPGSEKSAATPYHPLVRTPNPPTLPVDIALLKPGLRLAVGLSGGADSVALLCVLAERSGELGLVLHAAHLHHGLRGDEADTDLAFSRNLATTLGLPFHQAHVGTAAEARAQIDDRENPKRAESFEEAARRLRYRWFRQLMSTGVVDAVATAHTFDDQAETVLGKFLRGAWTQGLSGIHPKVESPEGPILRPLLNAKRAEIEAFLRARGQTWCEDSTNRQLTFTRNRIRHELLPLLESWNPQLRQHLAQMAELARDEEDWWQSELDRIVPQLILSGRPVRGGGRAASEGVAVDLAKFSAQPLAVQRRVLRFAAGQLGAALGFEAAESLRTLALTGRAGQKCELSQGLHAERTHRELRLTLGPLSASPAQEESQPARYELAMPGEVAAPAFGVRLRIEISPSVMAGDAAPNAPRTALLRSWKPGDRVRLRHSNSSRKVKEVLERLKVTGSDRTLWPVLECEGRVLWMRGVELEPEPGILIVATPFESGQWSNSARPLPAPKA